MSRNVIVIIIYHRHKPIKQTKEQTPWPKSASKRYRPSDRRLSAKLVPTFADTVVSSSQYGGSPTAVFWIF
jgi:hypothetical protein